MTTLREQLSAEFANGEVLHFTGRGNQTFDYIEDETVMDRLDDALGVGNWSIHVEPISVADGIVKVTLSGRTPDGAQFTYEDFGYQTRDGGESLKEAVSDGIRRCGRYLGVARYLYKKHVSNGTGRAAAPSSPARPAAVPARSSTTVPEPPEFPDDFGEPTPIRPVAENNECPIHGVTWNGEWGDLWHKDPDGKYCRHPENTRGPRAGARR